MKINISALFALIFALLVGAGCGKTDITPFATIRTIDLNDHERLFDIVYAYKVDTIRSIELSFGDGISLVPNTNTVKHIFAKSGTYTVRLKINYTDCSTTDHVRECSNHDFETSTNITIHSLLPQTKADFTFRYDTAQGLVHFQNMSANANNFRWQFGQSNAYAILQNPDFTYLRNGIYNVKLIANDSLGYMSDSVVYQVPVTNIR